MGAYGLVELANLADAVNALDIMLKAADVKFVTCEKKLGGRLVTIIVEGTAANVTEAVNAAKAGHKVAASACIMRPHPEIVRFVNLSAQKYKNKN